MKKEKDKVKARILVVDDEEGALDMLSRNLGDEGYDVVTVDGGNKALDIIKDQRFDAVLTDIKMENVDGIQVLKGVKELNEELPVIMMTAYASKDSSIEALNIGAFAYVEKPINNEELIAVIARAVKTYRLIEENNQMIIELHELALENKRLLEVVQQQNEELNRFKSKTEDILKKVSSK